MSLRMTLVLRIWTDDLPPWITFGHTVLCLKDPGKCSTIENYRPITCLLVMWKLLMGIIAEELHTYLEREHLLLD